MRLILLSLLTATIVNADTRSELDSTLAGFTGRAAIRARIEYEIVHETGDAKNPVVKSGKTSARLDATADGLGVYWDREQLDAASRDANAGESATTSARHAMDALPVTRLTTYLNVAGDLIDVLDGADLSKEESVDWQGRPARLLTFRLHPKLSEADRKYIKEFESTAKLWLDGDGIPIAAERQHRLRGRAMLVITFHDTETEHFEFARAGDRLVVTHHVKEGSGSGGGENNHRKSIARITIEHPATCRATP